jgi:hypothetical protein
MPFREGQRGTRRANECQIQGGGAMIYEAMIVIDHAHAVMPEPEFTGPTDEPIWALYRWYYDEDEDEDEDDDGWIDDGDGGKFQLVGAGLTHRAAELLARRMGLAGA